MNSNDERRLDSNDNDVGDNITNPISKKDQLYVFVRFTIYVIY